MYEKKQKLVFLEKKTFFCGNIYIGCCLQGKRFLSPKFFYVEYTESSFLLFYMLLNSLYLGGRAMVVETKQDVRSMVQEITAPWKEKHGGVIPVLQETQRQVGYLSREAMEVVSEELGVPLAELYGVATFYAQFHLKPRGRHIIRVCRGTACHVRGSAKIMDRIMSMLNVKENGTTDDLRFTLEPVACLGCCGLAPVVMIDEDTHGRLTDDQAALQKFLDQYA